MAMTMRNAFFRVLFQYMMLPVNMDFIQRNPI